MVSTAQVVEALREILTSGLLRIRASNSISFCEHEADHLHNIPLLLVDPSRDLIRSYFTAEKASYLACLSVDESRLAEEWYGKHWQVIGEYLCEDKHGSQ